MAEEKKKKGVTREERIKRSFPKGSKFVDKILKKDAEVGRDSKAIVAFPPQRGPGLPKQGVTTAPPKVKKETKPSRPKETKLAATKAVAASTLTEAQRQALSNNQAAKKKKETKKDPLAGKPRSIAAAKKAGQLYFFDKNGVKKLVSLLSFCVAVSNTTLPPAFGKVIVLSAVGSVAINLVSCESVLDPSNIIVPSPPESFMITLVLNVELSPPSCVYNS